MHWIHVAVLVFLSLCCGWCAARDWDREHRLRACVWFAVGMLEAWFALRA